MENLSDLAFILALPILFLLIAVIVERLIAIFDQLIVLNLFPFWRSAPAPPPAPPATSRLGLLSSQESSDLGQVKAATSSLILSPNISDEDRPEEPEFYYRNDLTHFWRLIYYIRKYGYFLSQRSLWQRLFRWIFSIESPHEVSPLPYSFVEAWLARRERVSQLPGPEEFARKIINDETYVECLLKRILGERDESCGSEDRDLDLIELGNQLELWADYCYLRNQRTGRAFSRVKELAYLFLSVPLGLFIGNLFIELLIPTLPENIAEFARRPPGAAAWRFYRGSAGAFSRSFRFRR